MAKKVNITFQPAKKKFQKVNFCRGLEIGKSVQLYWQADIFCEQNKKNLIEIPTYYIDTLGTVFALLFQSLYRRK
jgi:hypothetical protein